MTVSGGVGGTYLILVMVSRCGVQMTVSGGEGGTYLILVMVSR